MGKVLSTLEACRIGKPLSLPPPSWDEVGVSILPDSEAVEKVPPDERILILIEIG
jgi:hypothetical protein